MNSLHRAVQLFAVLCFAGSAALASAAEEAPKPYVPTEGQAGKDVVWVPTPHALVEKMLDLAKVTERDFVMDLGSGDGRTIIAAAKRGARGLGVEYNQDMVELARRGAEKEGVADKAQFVQGDMYEADISKANVLALFLLPENLERLKPKFLELQPGSRIVLNAFDIPEWTADATERADGDCGAWCTAHLYIVPAKVNGTWKMSAGELTLQQKYQTVSGSLFANGKRTPIKDGKLKGDRITFSVGSITYVGRVDGNAMKGRMKGAAAGMWTAIR